MSSEPDSLGYDFGYDPTIDEPIEITPLPALLTLPTSANVNAEYLPPVGQQRPVPSCAAWASTYDLATFTAAKAGNYSPTAPSQQASPAYIYIQVMQQDGQPQDVCHGSKLVSYFNLLAEGGTSTMADAPYVDDCTTLWQDYDGKTLTPDPAFTISGIAAVDAKVPDQVKQILASGRALAYGTSLYTDFPSYSGTPVPYVGSGKPLMNHNTGKPTGHCMLIVGYDDNKGSGAFYIQNSFGTGWGSNGFIWMAYDTFTALAQGKAFYVKD